MSNLKLRPIQLDDALFEGHISLERIGDTVTPWRIPFEQVDLFPPNGLNGRARIPAGVRLRFQSDTSCIVMETQIEPASGSHPIRFDCVVDGIRTHSQTVTDGLHTLCFDDLSTSDKLIEIYLPVTSAVSVNSLQIDENATLSISSEKRKRWVTYGSSITQCGAADGPSQSWPALVAQKHNLNFTCLGYGGNCHMEPMLARLIRDTPADLITLCLGINVYGSSSLGPRTFQAAVIGLIQIIREKHPQTPVAVISPIASPPRETKPNAVGLTLEMMREDIEDAVDRLKTVGDQNLFYVNGLTIFTLEDAKEHMPDQLHPDAEGYRLMAERIDQYVFSKW